MDENEIPGATQDVVVGAGQMIVGFVEKDEDEITAGADKVFKTACVGPIAAMALWVNGTVGVYRTAGLDTDGAGPLFPVLAEHPDADGIVQADPSPAEAKAEQFMNTLVAAGVALDEERMEQILDDMHEHFHAIDNEERDVIVATVLSSSAFVLDGALTAMGVSRD